MKHKISLFSIFFLIVLAFIFPSIVQAGSGCCGVVLPHTSSPQYQTTTSEQCATLNAGYAGSNYIFEEGKVAAKDAKTCTDGQVVAEEAKSTKPIAPQLQVSIPGFGKFSDVTCDDPDVPCEFPWIGEYIKAIYDYGLAVVGILSVIIMMIGGIIRLTAGGNHSQISQGNTYIKSSILGVVFTLCSYMILFIVNPNLTILRPINVSYLENIELEQILPPEDLTSEFTDPGLPKENLGSGQGKYAVPILFQGRYRSYNKGYGSCGCGPASMTMVLNFYGINVTIPEIADYAKSQGNWVGGKDCKNCCGGWRGGMDGFKQIANKYGLKSKTGGSFDDIKSLLSFGPVIASITNTGGCSFTCGGHYVVFTDYKNGIFYTNDPNEGNLRGNNCGGHPTDVISEANAKKGCAINMGVIAIYK